MPLQNNSFFHVIVHLENEIPNFIGLCAGFEQGKWRKDQLAEHLFNYIPEFALNPTEFKDLGALNIVPKIRKAARLIYQSEKFKNRGEFGELLLHVVLKELYHTIPAISKIYYKDSTNDTVKGFDAVHVVPTKEGIELWLGEVKFYSRINDAINDVIAELKQHSKVRYLRNEFAAITNKIDDNWEYSNKLKLLMNPDTSLDDVFDTTCIPVLLTYNSKTLANFYRSTSEYKSDIIKEFTKYYNKFRNDIGDFPIKIHLFLVPLNTKEELIKSLDQKLKTWQNI